MSVNKVILVGRVGKDPESKQTNNGSTVCKFSVATSERYTDKQGQKQDKTEWHNVVCFGKLADIAARYIRKGKQVYVEGKITTRSWEDNDGNKRYATDIQCRDLTFLPGGSQDSGNSQGRGNYQQPAQQPAQRTNAMPASEPVDDGDIPF